MSKTLILDTNVNNAKKNRAPQEPGNRGPELLVPGRSVGREIVKDYNEINLLELDDVKQAKMESWIAKRVGTRLMETYPNRQWGVGVDISGGMIYVMCPSLSLTKAYYISMSGRTVHDLGIEAVRAAGEILERYNVSRSRVFNPDHLETLERDLRDEVVSPDAVPEPTTKKVHA